jgi:hypothetical protein
MGVVMVVIRWQLQRELSFVVFPLIGGSAEGVGPCLGLELGLSFRGGGPIIARRFCHRW